KLGRQVQAIARLRLDRRDAMTEHLVEPAPAVGGQLLGRCLPCRGDGRQDAAARGQDLEIAGALLAELQLALPATGEEEVRVRVDEAGRPRATTGVEGREEVERVPRRFH